MATRDRKNLNIKRRREALREELKSREYLRQLHNISDEAQKADKDDIPALRLRADICFGLLKKTLPDLKQTEMTVDVQRFPRVSIELIGAEHPSSATEDAEPDTE